MAVDLSGTIDRYSEGRMLFLSQAMDVEVPSAIWICEGRPSLNPDVSKNALWVHRAWMTLSPRGVGTVSFNMSTACVLVILLERIHRLWVD